MRRLKIAAIMAAGAIALTGCSGANSTVMTIGDTNITANEIQFCTMELMSSGGDYETTKNTVAEILERAFTTKAVAQGCGITLDEDTEDDINSSIIRLRQSLGGKKAFDALLKQYKTSEDLVRVLFEEQDYTYELENILDVSDSTNAEMKQYFTEHYLRAKHVLILSDDSMTDEEKQAAQDTANDVLAQAQAGADFDTLIEQYGEDPGMSSNPNGYVFTDGDMVEAFETTTKELSPGEIGMCESSYGYHIILRLPLDETAEDFDELFEDNKSTIKNAMSDENYLIALKEKAEELGIKIEVDEDAIAAIKEPS